MLDRLAASVKAFSGLSYLKLAEVAAQWPMVGRGDLYYGGTTYENTQGLGVHLALAALTHTPLPIRERGGVCARMKTSGWLSR